MDKWKDSELQKMKVGGNKKAKEFFDSHSDIRPSMSLQEKYNSKTAALYRDKIRTLCEGSTWSESSSSAQNYKPLPTNSSASKLTLPPDSSADQDLEDFLNDSSDSFPTTSSNSSSSSNRRTSDYSGAEGSSTADKSRYVGFGNTPIKNDKDDDEADMLGKAWTSMQSGWSTFTAGATNLAYQAGDGMTKMGSTLQENVLKPSANQASKFGTYVNQSMIQPTKAKVNEGTLWTDISTSAGQLATKVKTGGEKGWGTILNWAQIAKDDEEQNTGQQSNDNGRQNYDEDCQQYEEEEKEEEEKEEESTDHSQPPLLIDFMDDPIPPTSSAKKNNGSTFSTGGYGSLSSSGSSNGKKGAENKQKDGNWNDWGDDGWGNWGGAS